MNKSGFAAFMLRLAAAALLAAMPDSARACGPFFPNAVLLQGDAYLVGAPRPDFAGLVRLLAPPAETYRAYYRTPEQRDACLADWAARAAAPDAPEEFRRYAAARALAAAQADAADGARARDTARRTAEIRAAWESLLALSPADRPTFTVEAVYALARLDARAARAAFAEHNATHEVVRIGDPEEAGRLRVDALRRYRQTRESARQGFADPMGRVVDSLGWEAHLLLRDDKSPANLARAFELYFDQLHAGDPGAMASLRLAGVRARDELRDGERADEYRAALSASPVARAVVSVFLMFGPRHDQGKLHAFRADWREALADTAPFEPAAALALTEYRRGNFADASAWLALTDPDAPLAGWVRAKLALRAGETQRGLDELARVVRALADVPSAPEPPLHVDRGYRNTTLPAELAMRARREWAVVLLSRRDYLDAARALLANDAWLDAAYMLERVLTLDELRAEIDARWPQAVHTGEDAEKIEAARRTMKVRWLLARRLARAGRWAEAAAYYPAPAPDADPFAAHNPPEMAREGAAAFTALRERGRARSDGEALWHAAALMRHLGMEMTGTEGAPDWLCWDGDYAPNETLDIAAIRAASRAAPADVDAKPEPARTPAGERVDGEAPGVHTPVHPRPRHTLAAPSADEIDRARPTGATPSLRFHYRVEAAVLAGEAAACWPDDDPRTAEALHRAGVWMWRYGQTPDGVRGARWYWEELRRRCPSFAKAARYRPQMRWLAGEADAPAPAEAIADDDAPQPPSWMIPRADKEYPTKALRQAMAKARSPSTPSNGGAKP